MSQRDSISRCIIIIRCLRNSPCTYKEIEKQLKIESELHNYNFVTSKRTFQRDVNDIQELFGINIVYNYSDGLYRIENNQQPEITDRIIESFETFSLLDIREDLSRYLQFESSKSEGSRMIPLIMKGISSRKKISFSYKKYYEGKTSERMVEPLGIKESGKLFYLVAKDMKDSIIKTFATDRISDIEITSKTYKYPESFSIRDYFTDCFGIIRPEDEEPEEIFLAFGSDQGKYIKSMPIHPSQVVISDSKKELRIRLRLFITSDFIKELLSFGETVRVISPERLVSEIRKSAKNTMRQYK